MACLRLGGSLKATGFGDGKYGKCHPQATLEAATLFNLHTDPAFISSLFDDASYRFLSHLNRNTLRILSLNRIPKRCVLVPKSARRKSSTPGRCGDAPNSDDKPAARKPRKVLFLKRRGIRETRSSFRSPIISHQHYRWTARWMEANSSWPVRLTISDWPNNWCRSRI